MSGLPGDVMAGVADPSTDVTCLFDQDWLFVLAKDLGPIIGAAACLSLADVRGALQAATDGSTQSSAIPWLARRPARLLCWALLWRADRAPRTGPHQRTIAAAHELLALMYDVAVTNDQRDLAELWKETWKSMRALAGHPGLPAWIEETARTVGLTFTPALSDEVGAALRSEMLPIWAIILGRGQGEKPDIPADIPLPPPLVALRLTDCLRRAREVTGEGPSWTKVDELLAATEYATTEEQRARLAAEIAAACGAWAGAKKDLPPWAVGDLETAVTKLPGSFTLYRHLSAAYLQRGVKRLQELHTIDAGVRDIARAGILDPLDGSVPQVLQQAGQALEDLLDRILAASVRGDLTPAAGRLNREGRAALNEARALASSTEGRVYDIRTHAAASSELAAKLGLFEPGAIEIARRLTEELQRIPSGDAHAPERATLLSDLQARFEAEAPALMTAPWERIAELAAAGLGGSIHALALLLPMPAPLPIDDDTDARLERARAFTVEWAQGRARPVRLLHLRLARRWVLSRRDWAPKLSGLAGIVLLVLGVTTVGGAGFNRWLRDRAHRHFEGAVATRDERAAADAARSFLAHMDWRHPDARFEEMLSGYRSVTLRALVRAAAAGDRQTLASLRVDAASIQQAADRGGFHGQEVW